MNEQVNVLVGINGAGKTALLDAIAVALFEIIAANTHGGRVKQWRQRKAQKADLKLSDIHIPPGSTSDVASRRDSVTVHAEAEKFYELPGFPSRTPLDKPATLEWTEFVTYQMPSGFHYEGGKSDNLARLHDYFRELWQEIKRSDLRAVIPIPVVAYYRANRRLGEMPKLRDVFESPPGLEDAFENALNKAAYPQFKAFRLSPAFQPVGQGAATFARGMLKLCTRYDHPSRPSTLPRYWRTLKPVRTTSTTAC